jgi:hypothetical protein
MHAFAGQAEVVAGMQHNLGPIFHFALTLAGDKHQVSVMVCQCQGTTHPVEVLTRSKKAPLVGSPFRTEALMQVGRPGKFTNLSVALAEYMGFASSA